MPLTLIQLISEQTMQNLLPVLRLKPERLVHLATPRTVSRSALVAEAARQANQPVALETITLSAMPGMRETHRAVLAAIEHAGQAGSEVVVNFTGGTKLMSIGAYVAASKHKTPSLYVDTQDALFVDGQTGMGLEELLDGDWSFTPLLRSLSVNAVARANGCARVTGGHDWRPLLPFAEHLLANESDEAAVHAALQGPQGLFHSGEPRKPVEWLPLFDQDLPLPAACCRLATECGLLLPGTAANSVRLPSSSRAEMQNLADHQDQLIPGFNSRYYRAVAQPQRAVAFLSGGWWEVIVADRMDRCGRFRDLRWSVQVGERGGPDLEEDVVALEGVQVVYVSCKRGGNRARLLPLLDEINARAGSLGGAFTRRFLAVKQKPRGAVLANLDKRAGELGIQLIFPENLSAADPFANSRA
jgi:hypothetical protein